MGGFVTIFYSQLAAKEGLDPTVSIVITLVACIGAGAFNGLMMAYVSLPALVATIAMSSFLIGMEFYISGSAQIYGGFPEALVAFGRSNIGPVPALVVVAAAIVLLLWLTLEKTVFGRYVKAVGGKR